MTAADIDEAVTGPPDLALTLFQLPPDAKFLPVTELSPRLRARIGPVEEGQSVITRPGLRVMTRLVPAPLADLINEFRDPSLLTDAVVRFARAHDEDPSTVLDLAFDALATLVESRILVPQDSPDAAAPTPSLSAGQAFAGFEIEALVRSLDDSEVYRARARDGSRVALKVARDDRPSIVATLSNEASILDRLAGAISPMLLEHASERGRAYLAMEWCDGVSIAAAAQQARATGDRRRLHGLVGRMLAAYGRLHGAGVIHGDVHPGNCIVIDSDDVVLLDFGNGRAIDGPHTAVDPARAGIPHFHDPLMAAELVAGRLPPAATPASEQFSIAVLAYLLLTGLHPIEAPAVQDELLRHIATRRPLPFASRGVAAWPSVEAVLGRAMAPNARDRFADVAAFSRAFASATVTTRGRPRWPASATRALDTALEEVRNVARTTGSTRDLAWFGLRSALALGDAELLAAADILSRRAGQDWPAQAVAAHVAQARSDQRTASPAVAGFITAAGRLRSEAGIAAAILAAATLLEDARSRSQDQAALADWARRSLDGLGQPSRTQGADAHGLEPLVVHASLALVNAGAVPIPAGLPADLEALREQDAGGVWLWALAHDVFADDRFMARARGAPLPKHPLGRSFALLRLHQLTGDRTWVTRARQAAQSAASGELPAADLALLMIELMAPERATLPPFLVPWPGAGRRPGAPRRVS